MSIGCKQKLRLRISFHIPTECKGTDCNLVLFHQHKKYDDVKRITLTEIHLSLDTKEMTSEMIGTV